LKNAVEAIRALNISGVNVTIPHKEKVIPLLDEISKEASFIGAVNTIVNKNGHLIGYNTDGKGFMQSLKESGILVDGKDILIIGAGGASRAISYYLSQNAKTLSIYNRNKDRAKRLVQDLKKISSKVLIHDDISNINNFHIIINATPLGLKKEDPLPLNISLLKSNQIVCDLIYKKTLLIEKASKKGCITVDGKGMLLWQGIFAFELWTGKKPQFEVMQKALRESDN
jgi:shikimate dehydrogenase